MIDIISYSINTHSGIYSGILHFVNGRASAVFPEGICDIAYKKNILSGTVTAGHGCVINSVIIKGTVAAPYSTDVFLKNGFQSWSCSGALGADDAQKKPWLSFVNALQDNVTNIPSGEKGEHTSEMFCCIGSRGSGRAVAVMQQPPFNQYLGFRYSFIRNELTIEWDIGKAFCPDEVLTLDPVEFAEGDCRELLASYAEKIKKKMRLKFHDALRTGWCSWYYYFTRIDADCILKNLAYAAQNKIPFDFFQIDDGYQNTVGDWLTLTPGFAGRMHEVTSAVKKAGYRPGLWIAPFITTAHAPAFAHPGWVLKDGKGRPVVAGWNPRWSRLPNLAFYALDITHPEVKDYIRNVITVICREWGFDYIKLDFMYAASLPGKRHDMTLTRAEILKEGNLLIRKAAGKRTVLLGCGMPISAAIGTMDAMRVSCDVSPRWGVNPLERLLNSDSNLETRGAIRNSIVRSFMDKRLWINDPDCLMLRKVHTKLNNAERRALYNAVMTIGGMVVVSDDLSLYGDEEYAQLKAALAMFKNTCRGNVSAPDLLASKIPELLWNEKGYFSVFNFSDNPVEKIISRDALLKRGIKASKLIDCENNMIFDLSHEICLLLDAHDSRMFRVKK